MKMLDPQARVLLDLIEKNGIPQVWQQTPLEARQTYRERRFFSQEEPPADVQSTALSAPGPHGPIPLRAFRPTTVLADVALPVLIYFHGGGWVIGDLDTHDVLCRQLARESQSVVVSVDYRLAPEFEFPAAVDDCLAVTRWVSANAASLKVDAARLAVGGDSAGGNLAAVTCLALREAGDALPGFQLLIYPATDMRAVAPSHQHNGQGYLLTRAGMAAYIAAYARQAETDWRAAPLHAPSHAGLPPALVLTTGFDPLRDDGRLYADALSRAGVPTQYVCFERQIHGFVPMGRLIGEARTALDLCGAALRRALE